MPFDNMGSAKTPKLVSGIEMGARARIPVIYESTTDCNSELLIYFSLH